MKRIIMKNGEIFVWTLAITELIIGIFSLCQNTTILNILVFLVCIGLVIDALIMGLGKIVGKVWEY